MSILAHRMRLVVNDGEENTHNGYGRLEVLNSNGTIWGTVCDDEANEMVARLVCKTFGLPMQNAKIYTDAYFGPGEDPIWLDNLRCRGYERDFFYCKHLGWGKHNCYHSEDLGVSCLNGTEMAPAVAASPESTTAGPLFARTQIRLMNGDRVSNSNEGRVEVENEGEWGTICDDDFGAEEAKVVCRMLGYLDVTSATMVDSRPFGISSNGMLLDDVNCTGAEGDVKQCAHLGWRNHNCIANEAVSVNCGNGPRRETHDNSSVETLPPGESYEMRLVNPYTGEEEAELTSGRFEVKVRDRWYKLCQKNYLDHHWLCSNMGLPNSRTSMAKVYTRRAGFQPNVTHGINFSCSRNIRSVCQSHCAANTNGYYNMFCCCIGHVVPCLEYDYTQLSCLDLTSDDTNKGTVIHRCNTGGQNVTACPMGRVCLLGWCVPSNGSDQASNN